MLRYDKVALKTRSTSKPWEATYKVNSSTTISYNGSNLTSKDELITSVPSNKGGENPFQAKHIQVEGSTIFCPVPPANGLGKYCTKPGPSDISRLSLDLAPEPTVDDAHIWAATNPSRPTVLLPVFWLELREIPDMLRQAGRFLYTARNWKAAHYLIRTHTGGRDLATATLAYQFGWAPLIGDLWKIANFQDQVDKRRSEINRLYSGKGLKRRIKLGFNESSSEFSTPLNFGSYRNFQATLKVRSTCEKWAVVRWKPTTPSALPPSDGTLRAYLTGLHPSHVLANAWEALPWSWLIDYFTNIGDSIGSMNHHLATPAGGSVMTKWTSVASHIPYASGLDRLSAGTLKVTTNTRFPTSGSQSLSASIPNLEARQLSVLSSLAFLRLKR